MSTIITNTTFGIFAERVQKFLANNYADISNNITTNEILLYTYGCMATVIEKEAQQKFMVDGFYPDQDGYITTYSFPCSGLNFDAAANEYTLVLPFPVVNLPLGYSIKAPYFVGGGGKSYPLFPIHPYQRGYDPFMPFANIGGSYYVENSSMKVYKGSVDLINSGWTLRVPMLSPRSATGDDGDIINIPDAALEMVFDMVIQKLVNRKRQPMNNVNAGVERYTEKP